MTPRHRRLLADADLMRTEFAGHPVVAVEPLGFDPPEQYRVTFNLPSARLDPVSHQPKIADRHSVLITLPASYPRDKPYCVTESAVFHPNFGANAGEEICIGDFWTPAQTLVDIVVKIGEMLQFQTYNVRSPLNALAAKWVAENESVFPLGTTMLFQAEPEIAFSADPLSSGPGEAVGADGGQAASRVPGERRDTASGFGDPGIGVEIAKAESGASGAEVSQGEGWWQASDGRWYPPHLHPDVANASSAQSFDQGGAP
jgi:hypothetical protein